MCVLMYVSCFTSSPSSGAGYPLMALRLGNRSNCCYANSLVVLLMFVGLPSHDIFPAQLAALFNRLMVSPGRHLWDDLIWRSLLAQWRRPSQQNDVAEFATHLFSRRITCHPTFTGQWQARLQGDERFIRDTGGAWPLVNNEPTDNPTDTQALIWAWHTQVHRHALSSSADLILLQLNRSVRASRLRNHVTVEITPVINVPVFCSMHDVQVRQQPYRVRAAILHRGRSFTSGHYQCVTYWNNQVWLHDDCNHPTPYHDTLSIAQNCYLVCYQRVLQ